jgi:hypothetical protein
MTNTPSPHRGWAGLELLLVPALIVSLGGAALVAQAASASQPARSVHVAHRAKQQTLAKPHAIHAAITINPSGGSAVVSACTGAGFSAALGSGASSITFACNAALSGSQVGSKWVIMVPQTASPAIDLASGTLSIDGSDGRRNDVVIDGGWSGSAADTSTGVQIFETADGTSLTLMNLTVQHANAKGGTDSGSGGVAETLGNFTATNVSFLNNIASSDDGGALELDASDLEAGAPLVVDTLTNDTFTGNLAADDGGALNIDENVSSNPQTVAISHNTFSRNDTLTLDGSDGGAIYVDNGEPATVTIDHTLFLNNVANDDGGAVVNDNDNVTITDSQFTGNIATNGVGGAVYADSTATTFTNVIRSSFISNSAPKDEGGAIDSDLGTNTVANSTFFGNSAAGAGGGAIANDSSPKVGIGLTLIADTIAGNSALPTTTDPTNGGGIATFGTLNLQATIISNNLNLFAGPVGSPEVRPAAAPAGTVVNCSGTITDLGYNLEFSAGAADTCGLTNGSFGDITGVDPKLAAMPADNGGPDIGAPGTVVGPQTLALLAGSPAISGVTGTAGASPAVTVCTDSPTATPPGAGDVDGRSLPRHTLTRTPQGCDIGAFDTGGNVTNPITITGAFNYLGAGWRLGFAASTDAGYPLGYITFQKGASTLTARLPIAVSCPNQCIGVTGALIPSVTVVLKLTGTVSSGRGAYAQGMPVEVDLSLSTSARSATATPSITATVTAVTVLVNGVAVTAVPGATAPFNSQSVVHFVLS